MPALNFTEISVASSGLWRDSFELFARDTLNLIGYKIIQGPDRGVDGGRDLIVEEKRTGVGGENLVRWLVSCKHKAYSGSSVSLSDELDIQDRISAHSCAGFIGFYSTVPSSGLTNKLLGAINKYENQIFDPEKIEQILLSSKEGILLAKRYFPKSIDAWQLTRKDPAKIFAEPADVKCDYCSKSLFSPEPHGVISLWHPCNPDKADWNRTEYIYFSCKGICDDRLRKKLRAENLIDGWEEMSDLTVPTVYLRWVMGTLNGMNNGGTYSAQAFEKIKDLLVNAFTLICRHPSNEEIERINSLQQVPTSLGGLGT